MLKEGWVGGREKHPTRPECLFIFSPKVFYILAEFVMVVYQERRVYISKNAGHTITDFN